MRAYSVTTGVWTRGIFVNEYGLDSSKVTWVVDDEEHVTTLKLPPNVVHAPEGKSLAGMMASGELQAGFTGPAGIGRAGPPTGAWEQGGQTPARIYPELIPNVAAGRGRLVPPHRHLSDPRHHRGEDRRAGETSAGSRDRSTTPSPRPRRPIIERLKRGEGDSARRQASYRGLHAAGRRSAALWHEGQPRQHRRADDLRRSSRN